MSESGSGGDEVSTESSNSGENTAVKTSVVEKLRNIHVHVPVFLSFFVSSLTVLASLIQFLNRCLFRNWISKQMQGSLISNQMIYKVCTVTLKYDEYNCSLLGTQNESDSMKNLEMEVQQYTTQMIMVSSMIGGIFPAVLSLFLGPWSDIHGRKPLIVISNIGYLLSYIIWLAYCLIDQLSPWYLVLPSIPLSIAGGYLSLITGSFCYISDVTTNENRSARLTMLEAYLFLGIVCGSTLSSYLFSAIGYTCVAVIACFLSTLSLLFTIFFIKESLETAVGGGICDVFNYSNVLDMVKTCLKPRNDYGRCIIWLAMLASAVSIFVGDGSLAVNYLFTRNVLGWNLQDYTLFNSFSIISAIIGVVLGVYILQKCFKMSDSMMTMLAYQSSIGEAMIKTFLNQGWEMYLAASVSMLRAVSGPMTRSIISKIVPTNDMGKIFSFSISLEAILSISAPTVYSLMYNATIASFPGAYHLVTAAFMLVAFIFQGIIYYLLRKYPSSGSYNPLVAET